MKKKNRDHRFSVRVIFQGYLWVSLAGGTIQESRYYEAMFNYAEAGVFEIVPIAFDSVIKSGRSADCGLSWRWAGAFISTLTVGTCGRRVQFEMGFLRSDSIAGSSHSRSTEDLKTTLRKRGIISGREEIPFYWDSVFLLFGSFVS